MYPRGVMVSADIWIMVLHTVQQSMISQVSFVTYMQKMIGIDINGTIELGSHENFLRFWFELQPKAGDIQ